MTSEPPSDTFRMQEQAGRPERRYCMPHPREHLTDETIIAQIAAGSRVLDLGCGDGRLLSKLRDQHGASVQGLEIERAEIVRSMERGIPVMQANLDQGLPDFPDGSFDFAVLSQTIQQVRHPRLIVQEMLRVARQALVVVPNFGHWRVRWTLLRYGRAPVTESLPYQWYETPNLHFMSMIDFRGLVSVVGARIVRELPLIKGRALDRAWGANWRAESALYVLERASHSPPSPTP